MLNIDNNLVRYNLTQIRVFTAIASLIFSMYAVYFDDIINKDGILYLQTAELFLSGNMDAAFASYNWPFYSIIIAFFQKLTSIPLELSALILNSVFFVILTDALILISSLIFSVPRQLKISALLILCFMPILDYRDYIIRDPGYWAFVMFSAIPFHGFHEFITYNPWDVVANFHDTCHFFSHRRGFFINHCAFIFVVIKKITGMKW